MSHQEAFAELDALMANLAKLSDEEASSEMARRIKGGEVDWWRVLQPLLVFTGRRWKKCAGEIRASFTITPEDEVLLGALPFNNGPVSTFAARNVRNGIASDDPRTLRTLFLCMCIARRVLNAPD